MLFLVHEDDGRITQANKVYDPTGYGNLLRENGLKHIEIDTASVIPIDEHFILKGEVTRRPVMKLRVSKDRLLAGNNDASVIRGIPGGSRLSIVVEGHESVPLINEAMNDSVLEFSAPAPGVYVLTFEKFPYLTQTVRIFAR